MFVKRTGIAASTAQALKKMENIMTPKQKAEIFAVSHYVLETLAAFANVIVQEKFTDHDFDGTYALKLRFWLFERGHDFVAAHEAPCLEFAMEGAICCVGQNALEELRKHFFDVVGHSEIHDALCKKILQRGGSDTILAYDGIGTGKFDLVLFPRITPAKAA